MCFGVSLDEEHKLITAIGRYSIVYDFISSSWKRQQCHDIMHKSWEPDSSPIQERSRSSSSVVSVMKD